MTVYSYHLTVRINGLADFQVFAKAKGNYVINTRWLESLLRTSTKTYDVLIQVVFPLLSLSTIVMGFYYNRE